MTAPSLSKAPAASSAALQYLTMLQLIERLHDLLIEMTKDELSELSGTLKTVQIILLTHIGENECAVADLRRRGSYRMSSTSYNLRKMAELQLIDQFRPKEGRRELRVRLTPKGLQAYHQVMALYNRHMKGLDAIAGLNDRKLEGMNADLRRLMDFWVHHRTYRL